jgi:hypothetical protein
MLLVLIILPIYRRSDIYTAPAPVPKPAQPPTGTNTNRLIFNSPDTIYFINVVDINYFVNGKLMLINIPEVRHPYGTGTGSRTGTATNRHRH